MKWPHRAYIGLGSNLQQPLRQLERALGALAQLPMSQLLAVSSAYQTAPLDCPEPQPDYLNAVALLETALEPDMLLAELQAIEAKQGRRPGHRNAPRVLDLDLLLFDDRAFSTPALTLPHPRMGERAFVLAPLLELAPDCIIPGAGLARTCLAGCSVQRVQKAGALRPAHSWTKVA